MLDPFVLLGISTNATVAEARQAYLQLAKLCHPDRGGHPEDMHILRNAYQWVIEQLQGAAQQQREWIPPVYEEGTTTVASMKDIISETFGLSSDDISNIVARYVKNGEGMDWFRTIAHDYAYTRIHADLCRGENIQEDKVINYIEEFAERYTEQGSCIPAAYSGGYGDKMVESSSLLEPNSFGTSHIVIYKEPNAVLAQSSATPLEKAGDGYGTEKLADYKEAMSSAVKLDAEWEDEEVSYDDALKRLQMARDLQDKLIIKPARIFLGEM
jgi:DnaJ domain